MMVMHQTYLSHTQWVTSLSVQSDTDRAGADTSSVTVSYAMSDGMTVSLENSEDVNELSVAYSSGAISVGVSADDAATESWEATMAYDLRWRSYV